MNIDKLAAKDAAKWAYAEMFFGEGAGTRRKLLSAEIAHKVENISEYNEAFNKAYSKQNFANLAVKAAKERQHIDRSVKVSKNVRGLLGGNRQGLSTGVLILVTVAVVANQTGYDKVIIKQAKKYYRMLQINIEVSKLRYREEKHDNV